MAVIIDASTISPKIADRMAAKNKSKMIGLLNCPKNIVRVSVRFFGFSVLGPRAFNRFSASAPDSPSMDVLSSLSIPSVVSLQNAGLS
jgi:hypothetical protein